MGQYKSQYTGPQIDAGINAALNPDVAVTPDSDALVTSGAVADALDNIDPTITSNTDTTLNGILVGDGGKVGAKSLDTSSLTNDADHVPVSSVVKSALTKFETDLASIHATGTTNTTDATITKDTYFYLNDVLVQALADIADNASFTENTNYETVTAGGLNSLMSAMFYRTGDTINISESNQIATWCLILSKTSIAIAVPLDKKCIANGATVTLGTAFIRAPGNANVYISSVTVTNVSIRNNWTELVIEGTVSSMSGASANTIGYAGFTSGTITFT